MITGPNRTDDDMDESGKPSKYGVEVGTPFNNLIATEG